MVKYLTTRNDGHKHIWDPDLKFTTVDAKIGGKPHKHMVNQRTGIALFADGHIHRLTRIEPPTGTRRVPSTRSRRVFRQSVVKKTGGLF